MNQSSDTLYKRLFKASQDKVVVLRPGSFEIIAVTDEYLKATNTNEAELLGKTLLQVFPDNPEHFGSVWSQHTLRSLQRVQSLRKKDMTGPLRYPVLLASGVIEERLYSQVNIPVLDDSGEIEFITHREHDVTSIIQQGKELKHANTIDVDLNEISEQSNELRKTYTKLQEENARSLAAQSLLHIGTWEYDVGTGKLNCSAAMFDIYDVPAEKEAPGVEKYLERVHPDDRETVRLVYRSFSDEHGSQIVFEHRVLVRNGGVKNIKVVGERHMSLDGEIVVGYVQDITPFVTARTKLDQAESLLRLTEKKMQVGGWRVILDSEKITWTAQTAAIHGMPDSYLPTNVTQAVEHYAPEYRDLILSVFELCATKGRAFDVICQLNKPDGQRPWVRVIGEAERDCQGKVIAVQGAFQDITTLRRAETGAERAETLRINMLESISDAFFALNGTWNFTYLNHQASVLLNRSAKQLLGKEIWTEFPGAVDSQFQQEYKMAVETKQTARFQAFFPPLNKWFDVSAYPMSGGLAVYFRDITSALEHQQRLRLVESALARQNDIVMITEANSLDEPHGPRIVYVNDAFERLTGYSKREAIGRTPRMLQGSGTSSETLGNIRDALEKKMPIRCELLNYNKLGEPYWLELDIAPLFDEEGQCTHFVAVERDITQRKQQEFQLALAQERFELISKAANDVIRDWDLVTDKIWWSDSVTDVFGYAVSKLEPESESWTQRIHPDDLDCVLRTIQRVIKGKKESWQKEYRFIKSNGQVAFVNDRGFVVRDANGKAVRMVGSMLDVTARMDMEMRLRESQKLEAVGHLTGGVAHDFNNLLTVIMGNAEMMAQMVKNKNLLLMAQMTLKAAQRGAELTSRLLAFARRQPLNPTPTDLNQVAEAFRELIRRTLPEDIALELTTDSDPCIAVIDVSELDTALLNLVVNARDAMPEGGKLTIETSNTTLDKQHTAHLSDVVPGDYVMICITDTGVGMNSETLSRAVDPFFTTKSVGEGSGLGLSMVFGFTKQSGGHLTIDSSLENGTTVKLYFPRVAQISDVGQLNLQAKQQPLLQEGTEHILIVEDDALVLKQLETQLRSLGYCVSSASSGADALKILMENNNISLLLTDIILSGGINGRELADRAHAISPSLKVLYSSGYSGKTIVDKGMRRDEGVNFLGKPYSRFELATKVRWVIEGE